MIREPLKIKRIFKLKFDILFNYEKYNKNIM